MRIMVFMNCDRLERTPCADRCNIKTLPSRPRILRPYHWMLCALAGGYIVASAQAEMTTIKFQPNSADINDLDHRLDHTRRIDGISPGGFAVTGPAFSVGNVPTGDANPNVRHSPLLEAAINPGIDNAGSANAFLANSTFTTKDYAFDFVVSHRQKLAARMTSGSDIGLWLEAGRHLFNNGLKFKMTLTPVPKIEAIYPIISLGAAIAFTRILRQRRTAQLKAGPGTER